LKFVFFFPFSEYEPYNNIILITKKKINDNVSRDRVRQALKQRRPHHAAIPLFASLTDFTNFLLVDSFRRLVRFVYFGGFRSPLPRSVRTYLPYLCAALNTLGNDTGLSRANCFFELTRFQPRFHYTRGTFSSSKLEQDPGQFADAISFVASRERCSRAREPYAGIREITYS